MNVLIVDDSDLTRRVTLNILRSSGLPINNIYEAKDGSEALEIVSSPIDIGLIICDLSMPGMNGTDTVKFLKNTPRIKDIPIIMSPSVAEKNDVLAALKAGADDYIVKPFNSKDIEEKAKKLIKF